MLIERSMNDDFLSNTYLVADELGSHAVMIDAGGPVEPLLGVLERMRYQLLTSSSPTTTTTTSRSSTRFSNATRERRC